MTTFTPDDSATIENVNPPDEPPTGRSEPPRALRRSTDDRIATGLAGGLGRYFGVDPVIFRIVFAVLALFGGSGIVLYLLGWLAIPEDGAVNAPLDRAVARLRQRSVPLWLVAGIALFVIWLVGFSWWEPYSFIPVALVVVALFLLLSRRDRQLTAASSADTDPVGVAAGGLGDDPTTLDPAAVQMRSWLEETRTRGRIRRARSSPVTRVAAALLIASLAGLVVADVIVGIPFGTYFWTVGAIALAALLVGLVTRRTPRLISLLLIPTAVGLMTFGTTSARAHDGFGQRTWRPANSSELHPTYRFGFGRSTVDLTLLGADAPARIIKVTQGGGQLRLMIPRDLAVRVEAHVHQGVASVGGTDLDDGWQVDTVWATPSAATATDVLTIDAHLSAGQILIDYAG